MKKKLSPEQMNAIELLHATAKTMDKVHARLYSGLSDYDITVSQFGVMEALHRNGALCQKDLGEIILKSNGNITMVVDNLVKRDYAVRHRDDNDRRFILVTLTDSGKAVLKRLLPGYYLALAELGTALSAEEQEQFICLLNGLSGTN